MRRLLWILLALLTVSLLVLVLQRNEAALAELSRFDSSSFETKIMAAALVGLVALTLFRQRFSHVLESLLIWAMLGALLSRLPRSSNDSPPVFDLPRVTVYFHCLMST